LDEATSALDGETESVIADSLHGLKGKSTLIVVAHRLATVREADQVIYMEEGKIICAGSFDEVRRSIPNFDLQARLMGL
jgi:ABC-type bacteriocin/lantibiotic exporter with double-glycine peptidase domain